jgi:hypothetical protein
VLSHLAHLNAKLLAAPQGNDNSGMLAVNLCRIATQAMSQSSDFFVYHPSAFTELHQKTSDRKRQARDIGQRRPGGARGARPGTTLRYSVGAHEIRFQKIRAPNINTALSS